MKRLNQKRIIKNNFKGYFKHFYQKSAFIRRLILINIDVFIIVFSTLLTFWISYPINNNTLSDNFWLLKFIIVLSIPLYFFTGQYQSLLKSFDINSIYAIVLRNIILIFLSALIGRILNNKLPYLSSFIVLWILISIQSIFYRLIFKELIFSISSNPLKPITNVSIYGTEIFG